MARLIKRFAMRPSEATDIIKRAEYNFPELLKGEMPRDFATRMLGYARAAKMGETFSQLNFVYNCFGKDFKPYLEAPSEDMELDNFLDLLDRKEEGWLALANPRTRPILPPKPDNLRYPVVQEVPFRPY